MRPVPLAGEAPAVAEILPLPPRRTEPPELLEPGLRNNHAVLGRPEASQRAVQQGLVPMLAERRRQDRRAAQRRDLPRARLLGDPLEVVVLEEDRRGRLRAPAGEAGKAVGRVADEREPVRDRGG